MKSIEHILDGCKEVYVCWVAVELERPALLSTVEAQSKIPQSLVRIYMLNFRSRLLQPANMSIV